MEQLSRAQHAPTDPWVGGATGAYASLHVIPQHAGIESCAELRGIDVDGLLLKWHCGFLAVAAVCIGHLMMRGL